MADYQLTQTGSEVQDILDSALKVTGSGVTLSQSGVDVQALLNDIPKGKFTWLTSINTSLYDEIPQAQAEWFMGWYDPNWANRPTDYGLIFRTTPNSASIPWSAEIAIAVGGEKGQLFVRTSENGGAWSGWKMIKSFPRTVNFASWHTNAVWRADGTKVYFCFGGVYIAPNIADITSKCTTSITVQSSSGFTNTLTAGARTVAEVYQLDWGLEIVVTTSSSESGFGIAAVTGSITYNG